MSSRCTDCIPILTSTALLSPRSRLTRCLAGKEHPRQRSATPRAKMRRQQESRGESAGRHRPAADAAPGEPRQQILRRVLVDRAIGAEPVRELTWAIPTSATPSRRASASPTPASSRMNWLTIFGALPHGPVQPGAHRRARCSGRTRRPAGTPPRWCPRSRRTPGTWRAPVPCCRSSTRALP